MGAHVSRTDFDWVYTEEPHATRRKEILEKYPEVKKLMGPNPRMKYIVTAMVLVQFLSMYLVRDSSWSTIIVLAYCFGGTINHSLSLAIHEIAHNLCFGHSMQLANRYFGFFANLPLGLPMSVSFKKYHLEHHRYQGDSEKDVDIPSAFECRVFQHTFTKLIWLFLQPYFYSFRPLFVRPKPLTTLEIINVIIQTAFDCAVLYFLGVKSLVYLISGTFLAMGIHPLAGHFISEHYVFVKGYETYSYYGPLNLLAWNVGYHNEHHDFPYVAGCNLPKIRKIAPEYYDDLPSHSSWIKVLWDFVFDPDIGPYARIRRAAKHDGEGEANTQSQ